MNPPHDRFLTPPFVSRTSAFAEFGLCASARWPTFAGNCNGLAPSPGTMPRRSRYSAPTIKSGTANRLC